MDTAPFAFKDSPMAKTRLPYAPEFRRQMVALVRAGRSPEQLAADLNRRRSRSGTGLRSLRAMPVAAMAA